MFILRMYQHKTLRKSFMMSGIEPCTSCTLRGCSNHCGTSVNTLICILYLRRYKIRFLLVKSHLVAGVERPAQALRRHPLQPCRRPAGQGRAAGFGGSLAWKHSSDPAMWRRTANRLRNRQRLESSSWPVFKFKQSESRWARVSVTPEP
jgi:hypothetical protein